MSRGRRGRWRDQRNTLPAKRRRRRTHRRDTPRGATYEPIVIEARMAQAGVRQRLWLGVLAVGFAMFCLLIMLAGPQSQFGSAAFASFGFTSLALAVASILSARREESVHRLANNLEHRTLLEDHGEDGSV